MTTAIEYALMGWCCISLLERPLRIVHHVRCGHELDGYYEK